MTDPLHELIEHSLDFTVHAAAVTPIQAPHSTGWRVLPELVVALPCAGARVRLEIDGGPILHLDDGEAFCVAGGIRHRATLTTARGVSRWCHIAYRILGGLDPLQLVVPAFVVPAPQGRRVGAICSDLARLATAPTGIASAVRRRALGFELLALILAQSPSSPGAISRMQALHRLAPILVMIGRDLPRGGPSIPALASAAAVSRSRLHALFRTALGRSPLQHILACRLRLAQHLLIGSDLAVAAVAARAGFGDAFHFSRTFHRVCGESPSDYRRRSLAGQA